MEREKDASGEGVVDQVGGTTQLTLHETDITMHLGKREFS